MFKREFAFFIQIAVRPIHKYPVTGHTFHHAIFICTSQYIIHHRLHTWIQLVDKVAVATIHIIIIYTKEPVESIVHDCITVAGHRVLATKQPDCTFHGFTIEEKIIIHQITLDSITTPYPAVAFDTVNKELAGSEMHGIGPHFPNTVQFFIIATETSTILFRKIFILHGDFSNLYTRLVSYINITEGFTVLQCIFVFRITQRRSATDGKVGHLSRFEQEFVQCFAICFIFCFFRAFTIINLYFSFSGKIFQCDESERLFSKIIKNTSFSLFCLCNRLLWFTHQTELGRKLGSPGKVPASGIHIDSGRCVTGFSALVNPFFIFVSHTPGRI